MMKKFLFASCVALAATGLYASDVSAQSSTSCCCGSASTVSIASPSVAANQTYQRFSYEPTTSVSPPFMNSVVEAPPNYVRPIPTAQGYRRFSYQPAPSSRSNVSGARKERWEYSKTDPRKYR